MGGLHNAELPTDFFSVHEHSLLLDGRAPSCGHLCLEQMASQQELHPALFLEDGTSSHV